MPCCQQDALYRSEEKVHQGRAIAHDELQGFVDRLRESPWFELNFPQVLRIEAFVRPANYKHGSVGAWHTDEGRGHIEMAEVHLTELFVLHEVSHVLAAARYGSGSHDPWFARIYLEAVYEYMGSESYAALREAFQSDGIDFDTDNSVPMGVQL